MKDRSPKVFVAQTGIEISSTGLPAQVLYFPEGPIRFGYSSSWNVDLGLYGRNPRKRSSPAEAFFTLTPFEGKLRVESRRPLLICGVERRTGLLPVEGTLRFAGVRVRFLGFSRQEPPQTPAPGGGTRRGYGAAAVAAASAGLLLLSAALVFPRLRRPEPAVLLEPPPGHHEQASPAADASAMSVPPDPGKGLRSLSRTLSVVPPGASLPAETVDILFIHAHPDDESLDFGALMAIASESGLRTAALILTDGEGGIFRTDYGGPRTELSALRITEAETALAYLGSSLYVRLGYRNHPYNGTGDTRDPEEILAAWGRDGAEAEIAALIAALRPSVVVSPDGPAAAREHFEHEAAGLLVGRALERLRRAGGYLPEGHLLCVDPRQTQAYRNLISFSRAPVLSRQKEALASHRTQADASYFGILMVEKYPEEWYSPAYWELGIDPVSYFLR